MTSITISLTVAEKQRLEKRAKLFGYDLRDFSRLAVKTFVPEPTEEDIFTPIALASIRRSERQIAQGKLKKIKSLKELI